MKAIKHWSVTSTLQQLHQQLHQQNFPLKRIWGVLLCPLSVRAERAFCLQEDKLITVSSVVTPAQFAQGQNVGCRSTVIAAVTFKSIILTLTLHEGEDGVLLLRWRQSLRGQQIWSPQAVWFSEKNVTRLHEHLLNQIFLHETRAMSSYYFCYRSAVDCFHS